MRITPSERRRRRRRRLRIWGALPFWLTALVLGLHLAMLNVVAGSAASNYHEGEIGAANLGFTYLKSTNVVERWKAPYNLGTSMVRGEEAWIGVFYLYDALDLAPEDDLEVRCTILINLAIGQEIVGDEDMATAEQYRAWAEEAQAYVDDGTPYPALSPWGDSTPEELRDESKQLAAFAAWEYQEALDARAECQQDDPPPEEQQEESETSERLEDKRDEAESQAEQQEEPQEEEPDAEAEAEEQRRQEELNERNAQAEAEAEAERQEEQGGDAETQGW